MSLEAFLDRVVAPGNYHVVTYNRMPSQSGNPRNWGSRTYPGSDNVKAANTLLWASREGYDAYHALASFTTTEEIVTGKGARFQHAKRTRDNAQFMKVLVMDADVGPGKGFADRPAMSAWLKAFCAATKMPMPNTGVCSGYGFHFYWILETPLRPVEWQPLADALKAAMLQHGWKGDTAPTIDTARILRPPGTINYKNGSKADVVELVGLRAADYPNLQISQALTPYLNLVQQGQRTGTGGNATVTTLGPRPAHLPAPGQGLGTTQAAHQGFTRKDYRFERIAMGCKQVQASLAVGGNGDHRDLWRLGFIATGVFCTDGDHYTHEISKGDPRYNQANVDTHIKQARDEQAKANWGPPTCMKFDSLRAGICTTCPHWQRIRSPWNLGAEDGDLPDGYRRKANSPIRLERWKVTDAAKGEGEWLPLVDGDVHGPELYELPGGAHAIEFQYEFPTNKTFQIYVRDGEMGNANAVIPLLANQGISCDASNAGPLGKFTVAWINKLRAQRAERAERVRAYGWAFDGQGKRIGCSVAGTFYRSDGNVTHVAGGDARTNQNYTPKGELAVWRQAAQLFENYRVDLETVIALSFGAPLIGMTGEVRGMSFNFWSTESAIGKTSAMRVGQAVWGQPLPLIGYMRDTSNSVMRSLSVPYFLVRMWDEARTENREEEQEFTKLIYMIPSGREKTRLTSDIQQREPGEWETILVFTSNRSMLDVVARHSEDTDSGVARMFEAQLLRVNQSFNPAIGRTLKLLENNYGQAGRIYAQWLAMNADKTQSGINKTMDYLTKRLAMQPAERFYIAGMAAAIMGARIAKELELFAFDVPGIIEFLCQAFKDLRTARPQQTMLTAANGYDIEQALNSFVLHHADNKLVTKAFANMGGSGVDLVAQPERNPVHIHIAETPKVMRINKKVLVDWMNSKSWPGPTIVKKMEHDWGAKSVRVTLGGGTRWASGQIWILEIPLNATNNLEFHLPSNNKSAPTLTQAKRPTPAAALAGNQPKV